MVESPQVLEFGDNVLIIDGHELRFPFSLAELEEVLGSPSRTVEFRKSYTRLYAYDSLGLVFNARICDASWFKQRNVFTDVDHNIICLYIYLGDKPVAVRNLIGEFLPTGTCHCELRGLTGTYLNGETYWKTELADIGIYVWRLGDGDPWMKEPKSKMIRSISISYWPDVVREPQSYRIRKTDEPLLSFSTFNFKLAIVQVLMYDLEVLPPCFDLDEFAEKYRGKKPIDLESDEPLAPVVRFFERLPAPVRLADKVEEIYMDGCNDIYASIAPQWDGEDGIFDLDNVLPEDLAQFPNLRKATIMSGDYESVAPVFEAAGIEVEPL